MGKFAYLDGMLQNQRTIQLVSIKVENCQNLYSPEDKQTFKIVNIGPWSWHRNLVQSRKSTYNHAWFS